MRTCFCPYCGTNLKFEDDDRDFGFCQYCGAKITFIDSKKIIRLNQIKLQVPVI